MLKVTCCATANPQEFTTKATVITMDHVNGVFGWLEAVQHHRFAVIFTQISLPSKQMQFQFRSSAASHIHDESDKSRAVLGRAGTYRTALHQSLLQKLLCMRTLLIPQFLIVSERTMGADETCRRAGCS